MTTPPPHGLHWSTAAFGDTADTAPGELCALHQHLQQCQAGHRRLRALGRGAEGLHGFVAPRFITTLALLATVATLVLVLF